MHTVLVLFEILLLVDLWAVSLSGREIGHRLEIAATISCWLGCCPQLGFLWIRCPAIFKDSAIAYIVDFQRFYGDLSKALWPWLFLLIVDVLLAAGLAVRAWQQVRQWRNREGEIEDEKQFTLAPDRNDRALTLLYLHWRTFLEMLAPLKIFLLTFIVLTFPMVVNLAVGYHFSTLHILADEQQDAIDRLYYYLHVIEATGPLYGLRGIAFFCAFFYHPAARSLLNPKRFWARAHRRFRRRRTVRLGNVTVRAMDKLQEPLLTDVSSEWPDPLDENVAVHTAELPGGDGDDKGDQVGVTLLS